MCDLAVFDQYEFQEGVALKQRSTEEGCGVSEAADDSIVMSDSYIGRSGE